MVRPLTVPELFPLYLGRWESLRAAFVSDVHLSERHLSRVASFVAFMGTIDVDVVVLMGDVFDAWVGDEQADAAPYRDVVASLEKAVGRGCRVVVLRGNRDFLFRSFLQRLEGVVDGRDAVTFDVDGRKVLVTHGDMVCRWDSRYAAWRRLCESGLVGRLSGLLPYDVGRLLARWARRGSDIERGYKMPCSIDTFMNALCSVYRDVDVVIAGHIHLPGYRRVCLGGDVKELYVVGGWEEGARYLLLDEKSLEFRRWEG